MLLCMSSSFRKIVLWSGGRFRAEQNPVELASDVPFEAADDLFLGLAVLGPAFDVVAGARVVGHPGQRDDVQGAVGLAVAAAVEPVPGGFAAGGRDRANPAQSRERPLRVQPVGVVTAGGQQL